MENKHYWVLVLIFLLTLGSRSYLAFQTENFSDDIAYFNERQINSIKDHLTPIYDDELSYGGRILLFTPLYQYTLSFISLFLDSHLVLKIVPNIFASALIFIVYLITHKLTGSKKAAVFSAFISGFTPVFFNETLNSTSIYSLVIPLIFFSIYCVMRIKEKTYLNWFIFLIFVLTLLHPSVFLLVIGLLIYLLIVKIENLDVRRAKLEVILFSTFFITWFFFLIYKKAFLFHGAGIIWQNIPVGVILNYFNEITILSLIYQIGFIPFIFGLYISYKYIFREKNRDFYLVISFGLTVFILLWLKLLQLKAGMMFLSVVLVLLFSQFCKSSLEYLKKTKFARYENFFIFLLVFVFLLTSVFPSFSFGRETINNSFSEDELRAFEWMRQNTEKDSFVLTSIKEGYLVTSIADRKNIMDGNFLMISNINQRFDDVGRMYITLYQTEAVDLLTKYDVDYIYLSDRIKRNFGIDRLRYIDENCFESVYDRGGIEIYKPLCRLEGRR